MMDVNEEARALVAHIRGIYGVENLDTTEVLAFAAEVRRDALQHVLELIVSEDMYDETDDPTDAAYSRAIQDCVDVVKALIYTPPSDAPDQRTTDTAMTRDPLPWHLDTSNPENPWAIIAVNGNWVCHCATQEAAELVLAAVNAHETPGVAALAGGAFPPWSAAFAEAIQHLLRREWAQCMNEGSGIDAELTERHLKANGMPLFPETPDAK